MISRFSTVYAGHVDRGDMGQAATPASERRYSGSPSVASSTRATSLMEAAPTMAWPSGRFTPTRHRYAAERAARAPTSRRAPDRQVRAAVGSDSLAGGHPPNAAKHLLELKM